MLTKRSIEVLLRVERMMDNATRTLTTALEPQRGAAKAGARRGRGGRRRCRAATRALQAQSERSCDCSSDSCSAFAVAAAFGLGLTQFALTRGTAFGAITIGAWTAWPKTGTADIDPYARAAIARSGELPIGSGDGVAFFASADDPGARSTGAAS